MNFTFTVSMGVTAKIASATPAPSPQARRMNGDKFPLSSAACVFKYSKVPKRTADFGIEP
jgi:hypothetical protein